MAAPTPPRKRSRGSAAKVVPDARPENGDAPDSGLVVQGLVPEVRVAGIGASAGGLEAFLELLSALPAQTGLAFVLIQHLDPRHDSMLVDILKGSSALPVEEAVDGMRVLRDHVYVIPPDAELTLEGERLRLVPRSQKVPHRPLDCFFYSLALERKSDAIGVVLSGGDSDGTLGLQAIRDGGGITFAQTPESAKFGIMPRAAASAADSVLPPAAIAARLVAIGKGESPDDRSTKPTEDVQSFERILELLRSHYPVDFGHFKRAGIERRILRRVLLGNHDDLKSYADSLENDRLAVDTLYQDLLIGVTSFFREPERFEALKTIVFPAVRAESNAERGIRIWIAGCSTGEEVYSIAMTLLEFLGDEPHPPKISIYGTDINEYSLQRARTGLYSDHSMRGVSEERRARFFVSVPGGYKIGKAVRELCVFAAHDVSHDPPYSKMDLVTCCNVLIYFDQELQERAVSRLQYALAPGGFLMLGSSESLRGATNQLRPVSSHPLVYRREEAAEPADSFSLPPRAPQTSLRTSSARTVQRDAGQVQDDDAFLATQLAPCGVIINENMEITRIRGEIGPFIALEPGAASLNLFRLLRHHELLADLRPAVRLAFREQVTVSKPGIVVSDGNQRLCVEIDVIPLGVAPPGHARCWIVFRSTAAPGVPRPAGSGERSEADGLREALAAVIEDRERLADEASAAAEEAQSSDEELRSTNEELETAKEELQSTNEELSTLNDELRIRNTALVRMNDDIENLLGAVEIPILFVGSDFTVRRFNLTAGSLLNLHAGTAGRLRDAKSILDVAQLETLAGEVMATNAPAEVQVQDSLGDWRLLRMRAYRTSDGKVDGAIIAILDINALKRSVLVAEEATRAAKMLSEASALLASSLDYETTLESLARLSTAEFADWCAVDLVDDDGSIRHLTVSHSNPVLRDLARQFQQASFSEPEHAPGAPQALRFRKSVLLADVAESQASGIRPEPRILQLIDALGVRSLISVPLIVRDRILGTTTFSSSRRRYGPVDLSLAEELSQRAAVAIDTAMLFREAESANRYKDAFLGTVAHELRTPLTSIIGWLQLARVSPNLKDDALLRIEESANLLKVFTEDLLDITRIREQKLKIDMKDIDFASVVRSALEMTSATALGQEIEIRVTLDLDPAPVYGDPVRLLQVVWNLLSNAIKFTPPGGLIDVRLERGGPDAQLSVKDNGIGISAEFAPHVFELYRQAGHGPTHRPGLGIGLSIVDEIVRIHKGTARVESPGLGHGSTFVVTLPLAAHSSPDQPDRDNRAHRIKQSTVVPPPSENRS